MKDASNTQPVDIKTEIERLHAHCRCAILATTDSLGRAQASYAPYAFMDGCYYIFISELAPHTSNIQLNPSVGILIIEDETSARNIYARTRLNYHTHATIIERDSAECRAALAALREHAGNTIDALAQLGGFIMVRLTPQKGLLVLGFGKAYELDHKDPGNPVYIDQTYLKNR